jgi:hypothetical protein
MPGFAGICRRKALNVNQSPHKGKKETTKNTKVHENQRVEVRMPFTL